MPKDNSRDNLRDTLNSLNTELASLIGLRDDEDITAINTYLERLKLLNDRTNNYVSALTAAGRQIREFHAAYGAGDSGMTKEQYTQIRNQIVTSSMAVLTELETTLRSKMAAYLEHASNRGNRTIDGISKSAGAVRYAVTKGVLEYLDKAEAIRNGNTVVLNEDQKAERVKETSFLKLFKDNFEKDQLGTVEERRIRAAEHAQTTMDKAKWKSPDHR